MTPQQQAAAADRRRVTQRRQDIDLLLSDLRARDLDVVFEFGETPVLSDGKLTPPESLALQHRELARRVQELLAPVGLNCRSDAANSPKPGTKPPVLAEKGDSTKPGRHGATRGRPVPGRAAVAASAGDKQPSKRRKPPKARFCRPSRTKRLH